MMGDGTEEMVMGWKAGSEVCRQCPVANGADSGCWTSDFGNPWIFGQDEAVDAKFKEVVKSRHVESRAKTQELDRWVAMTGVRILGRVNEEINTRTL